MTAQKVSTTHREIVVGPSPISSRKAFSVRPRRSVWRRLRRNHGAVCGLVLIGAYALAAATASVLPIIDPLAMQPSQSLVGPGSGHLLGTDQFGRDMLSRIVYGARTSLAVALASVALSLLVGTAIGLTAGYFGGLVDTIMMRVMDVLFSFPTILLALGIVAVLGPGARNLVLAIAAVYTPIFARIVRGPVLSLREKEFVEAARCMGGRSGRILLRHILPNLTSTLTVQASLALSWATLTEAALSFVGLGTQPPFPSWGAMLYEGRSFMELAPWMAIFPGLAIMLVVLGFNLLGDGLRDVLDPRLSMTD